MPSINQRAAYVANLKEFLAADPQAVLGALSGGADGDVAAAQMGAWKSQIDLLQVALPADVDGVICFEFVIPRIGKRADNILLIGDQVIVLEFKVGAMGYDSDAKTQAVDYALDLKNFHRGSHDALIVPVLVATKAPFVLSTLTEPFDGVYPVVLANAQTLACVLRSITAHAHAYVLSHSDWLLSGYRPTPTIVEASQVLYRGHSVAEITHSESGADNLGATTQAVAGAIDHARTHNEKIICLISGVPGAGKTLAGLNLVCERRRSDQGDVEHAVFLSGNGPLVMVLQEALARDDVTQASARGARLTKTDAHRKAVTFIQNIHHFRDEYLKDLDAPTERVVVFDEAQRAWNKAQTSKFMQQKRNLPDFDASEPEFLISVLDRHAGWAVIVCLVGGGQEINTGEAGIEEWLRAVRDHFPHWHVHLPSQLEAIDYLPTFKLDELSGSVTRSPALHLSVSLRSFRSERVSASVAALMAADLDLAQTEMAAVLATFPIAITRSLEQARRWLRERARGSERYGLLASSGARRIKPLGINMDVQIDPCTWFLNAESDVRSSYYLEDAARMAQRSISAIELLEVIDSGETRFKDDCHLWAFKHLAGRADNLICAVLVLEDAVIVKTVMHDFMLEG